MRYAISHALLGTSYVATLHDDPSVIPDVTRLRDDASKEEFLLVTLKPGDTLFTDLGGATDKVALVATVRGAEVHRIPTFRLGNKASYAKDAEARGWTIEDEPSHGNETSDELTVRKARAIATAIAAVERTGDFVHQRDEDQTLLLVKQEYRSFRMMQKVLLANTQRLLSTYNDRYLLELAREVKPEDAAGLLSGNKVSTKAAKKAIEALLVDIPEHERGAFMQKLGLDKLEAKKMIPRTAVKGMFAKIIEALLEAGPMSPFMTAMKETEKSIQKRLKGHAVFCTVFEPIPGCGPRIAARMLAAIVDIRRFESIPALKAYAGYHHFEDGSRARRRAGKVSNWNTELKQAVFLWTEQTLKMPASPWREKLDRRRAYELYKILKDRQSKAVADGLGYEIMPVEFTTRSIACVNDVTVADLAILNAHVDALRKAAGIKPQKTDEESEEGEGEDSEAAIAAKDPKLARLVRGVKMQGLLKAKRWLGQQLLKHIFRSWRATLGLPEFPATVKSAPTAGAGNATPSPEASAPLAQKALTEAPAPAPAE
ncbi:MAG TPA: transposase [Candidatus Methylomirabilis sp.]|nr:transposase [Candidatus Methylomirabilis sp.]